MRNFGELAQGILAVGFLIASFRLYFTARRGRRNIRLFRYVGSALTLNWAAFYAVVFLDHILTGDYLFDLTVLAAWSRTLQYFNVTMFLLWGFLFHQERWEEDARANLDRLRDD